MMYRIQIAETGASFEAGTNEPVLDAALRAGVPLAHECRSGGCGSCRVRLLQGRVRYEEFPIGLTPEEAHEGFALACQARAEGDLVISAPAPASAPPEAQRCNAVVRSLSALSADVLHLRLELPQLPAPRYLAGQHANILLEDGSFRSFSMASAPGGTGLDFHIRRIPGGRYTDSALGQLAAGHRIEIEFPLGSFTLDKQAYRPLLMVATGTGLAPIKSMLEALMDDPDCPPVTLYWGMRRAGDLYLHPQIQGWGERLYDFRYIPVLSQADAAWSGRRGHVTDAIAQDFSDLSEHAIYLCGSPAMIRGAKPMLMARGASTAHVHVDSFEFQRAAAVVA